MFADDIDDAAQRLRAVQRADRTADDLNALHIVHIDALQLIVIRRLARILRAYAPTVDEDQRLIGTHAAQCRLIPDHAVFRHIQPDGECKRLCQCLRTEAVDILTRHDLNRSGGFFHTLLCTRCRDNNIIERIDGHLPVCGSRLYRMKRRCRQCA